MGESTEGAEGMDLRIVIVGGGLAGLATALSLQQAGLGPVTVFERDEKFDDRRQGYGLTLTKNMTGPLAKLGILDECIEKNCTSTCHWVFNPEGEIKGYFGRAFDSEVDEDKSQNRKLEQRGSLGNLRVPRQDLRKMLLVKLKPGTVVWGQKLMSYDERDDSVLATFTDCKDETNIIECDVLIGADGIRSRVREIRDQKKFAKRSSKVVNNDHENEGDSALWSPTPLKYLGVNVIIGLSTAVHPLLNKQGFYVLDGVHRLFTMPFREANEENGQLHMWQLSFSGWTEDEFRQKLLHSEVSRSCKGAKGTTDPDQGNRLLVEAMRRTDGWMDPVQELVAATRPEDVWGTSLYDRDPMWLLDTGASGSLPGSRVTLVGDACHPMSMFKGQGANMALEDGPLLAYWLQGGPSAAKSKPGKPNRKSLLTRLRNFERQMVARSSVKQRDSRAAAKKLHALGLEDYAGEKEKGSLGSAETLVGFGFEGVAKEYRMREGDGASDSTVQRLLRRLREKSISAADGGTIEEKVAQCIEELRKSHLDEEQQVE